MYRGDKQPPAAMNQYNKSSNLANCNNLNGQTVTAAAAMLDGGCVGGGPGGLVVATGQCVVCRKPAVCVCQRCGDYYCSPQCQRIDWPAHRYICFPIPALVQPHVRSANSVFEPQTPVLISASSGYSMPDQQKTMLPSQKQPNSSAVASSRCDANSQQSQSQTVRSDASSGKQAAKRKEPRASMPTVAMPKTNSRVMVVGFRSTNRVAVRALTAEEEEKYMLSARKIDSYGKTAPPLTKTPTLNSYAITELEGVMCRVQIIGLRNDDAIRVLFCDRGITATRRLSELREISNEIVQLMQQAVVVPLRYVANYAMKEQLTRFLTQFEDMEFTIKYDGGGADGVELLHIPQKDLSLNNEIIKFCKEIGIAVYSDTSRGRDNGDKNAEVVDEQLYAGDTNSMPKIKESPEKPRSVQNVSVKQQPVMKAPFETYPFKVGGPPFTAIVLDVSCLDYGYIGCIEEADMVHLKAVHQQINLYKDNNQPYCPQENEYCLAKFEDQWYRAKVIDIPDDTHYNVIYVDFTNEATVTSADIRRFPDSLKGDCRTNLCLIDGLPSELSSAHIKFLNKALALQGEITIDRVKEINEQITVVECRSLLENMRKEGLL